MCAHRVSFEVPGFYPLRPGNWIAPRAKAFPSSAHRAPPPGPAAPRSSPPPTSPGALPAFPPRCFDPGAFLFVSSSFLFVALKPTSPKPPAAEGVRLAEEGGCRAPHPPLLRPRQPARPPRLPDPPPAFVRPRKPAESSLMHPFQWCNGESRAGRARGAEPAGDAESGAPGFRSEGSFSLSSQVFPETGPAGRRPGARLCSAHRGIWGGKKKFRFNSRAGKDLLSWRRAGGAGRGRGSRGVPGLCVAASHSYPLPLPLCAQTLFFVVVVAGELNPRSGSDLLEGAQVPGLKLFRLF